MVQMNAWTTCKRVQPGLRVPHGVLESKKNAHWINKTICQERGLRGRLVASQTATSWAGARFTGWSLTLQCVQKPCSVIRIYIYIPETSTCQMTVLHVHKDQAWPGNAFKLPKRFSVWPVSLQAGGCGSLQNGQIEGLKYLRPSIS